MGYPAHPDTPAWRGGKNRLLLRLRKLLTDLRVECHKAEKLILDVKREGAIKTSFFLFFEETLRRDASLLPWPSLMEHHGSEPSGTQRL